MMQVEAKELDAGSLRCEQRADQRVPAAGIEYYAYMGWRLEGLRDAGVLTAEYAPGGSCC